jgi:beta-phosphoglucomutase-like phosphatase (HAD superfamily)
LINEILEKRDIAMRFSPEDLISEFLGLSFRRILVILQRQLGFELNEDELETYNRIQQDRVVANIEAKIQPCPGVTGTLARLHQVDDLVLAVASSSSLRRIRTCLQVTGLIKYFDEENIFSAADSVSPPSSKPDPAVYFHALERLGARTGECLTVEDSISGVRAAVGANLKCLGYVGSTHTVGQRTEMAMQLLDEGCVEIMWHWGSYSRHLSTIEDRERNGTERVKLAQGADCAADV